MRQEFRLSLSLCPGINVASVDYHQVPDKIPRVGIALPQLDIAIADPILVVNSLYASIVAM